MGMLRVVFGAMVCLSMEFNVPGVGTLAEAGEVLTSLDHHIKASQCIDVYINHKKRE